MDKKLFIKNRPLDTNDINATQDWTEDAIKNAISSIFSYGIVSGLDVTVGNGLQLNVAIGKAFDSNYDLINVKSSQSVTLNAAHATLPRIDKIIVKYRRNLVDNVDTGNVYGLGSSLIYSQNKLDAYDISVVTGISAVTPVEPATPTLAIELATVYVGANVNSLTQDKITDKRKYVFANSLKDLTSIQLKLGINNLTSSMRTSINPISTTGKTIINMAPLFDSGLWTKHSNATVNSPTKLTHVKTQTSTSESNGLLINAKPNTTYTAICTTNYSGGMSVNEYNGGTYLRTKGATSNGVFTFTTSADANVIQLSPFLPANITGTFTFENIALFEGNTPQQFIANVRGIINPTIEVKNTNVSTTADLKGKIPGSNVENPHYFAGSNVTSLQTPSSVNWWEGNSTEYNNVSLLNGAVTKTTIASPSGAIAQHRFSFNLIRMIEDKYGLIPAMDKASWLRTNIKSITPHVYARGSNQSGNKVSMRVWDATGNTWGSTITSHSLPSISELTILYGFSVVPAIVDSSGSFHCLVYAEASDGVVASIVETDYVNLDVELKSDCELLVKSRTVLNTTLHSINGIQDEVFKDIDGRVKKRAHFRDRLIDGGLNFSFSADLPGVKRVVLSDVIPVNGTVPGGNMMIKYDGKILNAVGTPTNADEFGFDMANGKVNITIADTDSGWGENYTPTADEIKAYFMGWRMRTDMATTPYTSGTKYWGTIASGGANNGTYNLPTAPAPDLSGYYRLIYQLATPQITELDIQVNALLEEGTNTVELKQGVIVRERVNPVIGSTGYENTRYINDKTLTGSALKNKANRIIAVYKNGVLDADWNIGNAGNANGNQIAIIGVEKFDTSATYTVTYEIMSELSVKAEPVNVEYATSLKSTLTDNAKKINEHENRLDSLPAIFADKGSEIVEMGANVNGKYIRYANGIQICLQYISFINVAASTQTQIDTPFPATFNTSDWGIQMSATVGAPSTSNTLNVDYVYATWTGQMSRIRYAQGAGSTTQTIPIHVIAIGRWK